MNLRGGDHKVLQRTAMPSVRLMRGIKMSLAMSSFVLIMAAVDLGLGFTLPNHQSHNLVTIFVLELYTTWAV